jgi:hypothetical protein
VHQGAAGDDHQFPGSVRRWCDADEARAELEKFEVVDKIPLDEAQGTQVGEFLGKKAQRAQMRDLRLDLALQRGQRLLAAVAALEVVLAGGPPESDAGRPAAW